MFAKYGLLALSAAACVHESVAHRHGHHQHAKREVSYEVTETVIVTEYVVVTCVDGVVPTGDAPPAAPPATSAALTTAEQPVVSEYPAVTPPVPTTLETYPAAPPPSTDVAPPASSEVVVPTPEVPAPEVPPTTVETPTVVPTSPPVEEPSSFPTSSPTFAPPPPAPTAGGGKRGLAYNDPILVTAALGQSDQFSWSYNWGSKAWDLDANITFYPTMWGPKFEADWFTNADEAVANGCDTFLSFNEPDIEAQAFMDPGTAVSKFHQYFDKYIGTVRIGAPSVSSSQEANRGLDWLGKFFDACGQDCPVDFCNAHWYGPGGEAGAEEFLGHIKNAHEVCGGKPVWVTEFGATGDVDGFMRAAMAGLESEEFSFVEKYSYFFLAIGGDYLMKSSTELSPIGEVYAGLA